MVRHEVVSPASSFRQELVEHAERFERFQYVLWILSQVALLATLWVYARRGVAFTRESSAGPIGTGMLLGMLGLAIVWLVAPPVQDRRSLVVAPLRPERAGYLEWLLEDWAILGAQFFSLCLALLIVMGLARWLGDWWWLPGAAVFVAIAAAFTFAAPYIDYTTEPLRDEQLLDAARHTRASWGWTEVPIHVQEVSDHTELANAYAYGFGPTKRGRVLGHDPQDPFDDAEQRSVLAHELAHHSQDHLPEGIGWFAIFAVPGAFVLMLATSGRGGMGAPEAIPLALLVVAVVQLVSAPANRVTRRMEEEADWKALEVTRDPAALEGLMIDLAGTSLNDPNPPAGSTS